MRMRRAFLMGLALLGTLGAGPFVATTGASVSDNFPTYLRDRGTGIATSLFGTYVRKGELLAYPFYEYTGNNDQEYKPSELGFAGEHDYRGKYTEQEGLIFLSYGISESVALELESALYSSATLHKAPGDPSAVPTRLKESGLGVTQTELGWEWWREYRHGRDRWADS